MDNVPDINACRRFANLLRQNFSLNYNLELTKLSTKIEQLCRNDGKHILIFYLHHCNDPFSLNFCFFLKNPKIAEAFRKDHLVLYAWDITDENQKDDLIESFKRQLGVKMADYIVENRSVAFRIVSHNDRPSIVQKFCTAQDLILLRDTLLENLEKKEEKPMTPLDFQRSMEKCMNFDEYSSYERNEHSYLKKKIKYALYGPPKETEEEIEKKPIKEQTEIRKNMKKEDEAVNEMFNKILETNNTYCKWNGRVVMKIIYICAVTLPKEKAKKAKEFAEKSTPYSADSDFVPYPVFILRKCKHKYDPSKACRIIIDIEGRVYESWNAFLENNRLPPCEIFYPMNGRYVLDNNTTYCYKLSPACDLLKKAAAVTDVAAGITGVLAGGVSIAGSSAAVIGAAPFLAAAAPVVLPVAAVVGIGSGIYAVGRSISSLVDRKKHKQDIDLTDAESRGAYLNIAGGALTLGVFGAVRTVSFLAARGVQLGQGTRAFLYTLNGINLTVGGVGIGNGIHQAMKSKTNSPLVILQLGASILFFTHSVYSFKSIGTVIEESQNRSISEIELSLRSNRHRRTFNKLLKESIRTQGESQGKASVISSIRNMENVDDVLAVLTRSNKMLNKEGIRFSAVGDQIMLNGRPVDMMNFGSMSGSGQSSFLQKFPPIPENLAPNVKATITGDVMMWVTGLGIIADFISHKDVAKLVDDIFCGFKSIARDYILDITKRFFKKVDPRVLNMFADKVLDRFIKLLKWVTNKLMNNKLFKKILNKDTERLTEKEIDSILETLDRDLDSSYANFEYDNNIKDLRKQERRSRNRQKSKVTCGCCGGYYYKNKKKSLNF